MRTKTAPLPVAAAVADKVPAGKLVEARRVLRLSVRELGSGLSGFGVFVACLALGVAVIMAVGALTDALKSGFERQGEILLGGDLALTRPHQRASAEEIRWLRAQGPTSETASMRAVARSPGGQESALVEIKGVDGAWPLVGAVALARPGEAPQGNAALDQALRAGPTAIVEPILLERLGLKIGDSMRLGETDIVIAATLVTEPDRIATGIAYGARVLVSLPTLEATGLVKPGSLIRWRYAVKLTDPASRTDRGLGAFRGRLSAALPEAGFIVADRRDPSPQITRTLERLRQFLTLIGLTALLVGGVGVANAVATFIDRRRKVIATLKSLGATGTQVLTIHLVQVMLIALVGIAIGVVIGLVVPMLLGRFYGDLLPIKAEFTVGLRSTAVAMVYGFLVALVFTLWPLGRAELIRAAVLFREHVAGEQTWPRRAVIAATGILAALLGAFAIVTSDDKLIALFFLGGLVAVFALFLGLGAVIVLAARRLRRSRRPEVALAIGNIGWPGTLTRSVVLSLGAGLSLLVAVALVDASIVNELTTRAPREAPNYFVLDIAKEDIGRFGDIVKRETTGAKVDTAPMLRGRLVRLNGQSVDSIKATPRAQWVLQGDRGLSYADDVPAGSRVIAGAWWPKDYEGEPLVSFEIDLARGLGLKVGDTVTVNVLGRNVTARISNLREVHWESLGINFVMVFSPNTLRAAPNTMLATVTLPAATTLETEARLARVLAREMPSITAIRVKDAINAFNVVFGKVMVAVRSAGAVTLLAGALVLAGALATAQRRRIQQAVILKTLGATRRRILAIHLIEYVLLATATALIAVLFGTLTAWVVLTQVMDLEFTFSWAAVAQAVGVALALVLVFGGLGTWRVLSARPVPYLRSE